MNSWYSERLDSYFTESVYKVVQKKIPAQIRQLIFILLIIKDKLMNVCGNRLLQNGVIHTFCEMNHMRKAAHDVAPEGHVPAILEKSL